MESLYNGFTTEELRFEYHPDIDRTVILFICNIQVLRCVNLCKQFFISNIQGCVYDLEVFKAGKKGWGVRANEAIDA